MYYSGDIILRTDAEFPARLALRKWRDYVSDRGCGEVLLKSLQLLDLPKVNTLVNVPLLLDCCSRFFTGNEGPHPGGSPARALPTETKVETGTSKTQSGTYVDLSNNGLCVGSEFPVRLALRKWPDYVSHRGCGEVLLKSLQLLDLPSHTQT